MLSADDVVELAGVCHEAHPAWEGGSWIEFLFIWPTLHLGDFECATFQRTHIGARPKLHC